MQPAYRADEVLSAVARATERQALEGLLTRLKHLSENSASQLCNHSLSDQQSIPEETANAPWEGTVFKNDTLEFIVLFFFGIGGGFAISALYWVSL